MVGLSAFALFLILTIFAVRVLIGLVRWLGRAVAAALGLRLAGDGSWDDAGSRSRARGLGWDDDGGWWSAPTSPLFFDDDWHTDPSQAHRVGNIYHGTALDPTHHSWDDWHSDPSQAHLAGNIYHDTPLNPTYHDSNPCSSPFEGG